MERKRKIALQAESDRHWANMRDNQEALLDILTMRSPTELDVLWSIGCIKLVYNDLALYKDTIGEDCVKDIMDSPSGETESIIRDQLNDLKGFSKLAKFDVSLAKKQKLIDDLRNKMWDDMLKDDDKIKHLIDNFSNIKEYEDIMVIYKCVSIVCFELKVRDLEIILLEDNF